MTRDYAKSNSDSRGTSHIPPWVWFLTGFVSGMSVTFLVYLDEFVPSDPDAKLETAFPALSDDDIEEIQWDFYELFTKAEVPVVEEFSKDGEKVIVTQPIAYLLQTGSFRNIEDADKLRAKLLLLGLQAFSKEATVEGKKWHRVFVGPMDSTVQLNRTQDQLAAAKISSLPLKIKPQ